MLRNQILTVLERATLTGDEEEQQKLLTILVVGGGPTGVELAGALGEMKHYIIRRDYPELRDKNLRIVLVEGSDKVLGALSEPASRNSRRYLEQLGVEVMTGKRLTGYDGVTAKFADNSTLQAATMIWTSGIGYVPLKGMEMLPAGRGGRLPVDGFNRIDGHDNVFVMGDACLQTEPAYPGGHPQVAPVAMQQAKNIALNFQLQAGGKPMKPFRYHDKGSMAIVGRNRAVADVFRLHLGGFVAWAVWLFVHLISIIGVKRKLFIMMDWAWAYISHDASLRVIIRQEGKKE